MTERRIKPNERHRAFRDDMIEVLRKHAGHLDSKEMLALSAHLVGQIIAMQDQRVVTPALAMEIVAKNIELGNSEVIDSLLAPLKGPSH